VRAAWQEGPIDADLAAIQSDLFDIGALLASAAPNEKFRGVAEPRIEALEQAIDRMESELAPLRSFVLPGGSPEAAATHVARTVCRRSERMVVALGEPGDDTSRATRYLNRLSDFLFVASRYANHTRGVEDVPWKAR
jgi:cob(I)alamin adenosyltransferase